MNCVHYRKYILWIMHTILSYFICCDFNHMGGGSYVYTVYMDYMDLVVCCPRKAVKLTHSRLDFLWFCHRFYTIRVIYSLIFFRIASLFTGVFIWCPSVSEITIRYMGKMYCDWQCVVMTPTLSSLATNYDKLGTNTIFAFQQWTNRNEIEQCTNLV